MLVALPNIIVSLGLVNNNWDSKITRINDHYHISQKQKNLYS